jgi:uncharacterized protein (DUF924 family)
MDKPEAIIKFWFEAHNNDDWFGSSPEFDQELHEKFFDLHTKVSRGEAYGWRITPLGRLAEILVLDQFSRQFFRKQAQAFASDPMALTLAQELVASGDDKTLTNDQRIFAYMPYMHSESLVIHDEAVRLFTELGIEDNLKFENSHRDLIVRFSRYPMRNAALGRQSSAEELAYIKEREGRFF